MSTSHGSSPRERSVTARQQCSGRCPGVWITCSATFADRDLVAVADRFVRVLDAGLGVDADGDGRARVRAGRAPDVVRVRMCLDRADDPYLARLGLGEQRLDLERGVDHHRDPRLLVSHQIGRTPEIVVHELMEDHGATVAAGPAISLEVSAAGSSPLLQRAFFSRGAGGGCSRRSRKAPQPPPRRLPTGAASVPESPSREER